MNGELRTRLNGIHASLMAAHSAGIQSTNASKDLERDIFMRHFLAEVLPTIFWFGHGDIVDSAEATSGQIDIIIENPFFPSSPIVEGRATPLFRRKCGRSIGGQVFHIIAVARGSKNC